MQKFMITGTDGSGTGFLLSVSMDVGGRRRRFVLFGAGRPGIPTVSSYSRRVFS